MIGEIKRSPEVWDRFYAGLAYQVALMSKDPHRQVGAVLVTPDRRQLSIGYNGFPAGMPDLKQHLRDKDFKRAHMIHAEDNCLRQAPFSCEGCTIYVTSFPCKSCAEKIVAAKVARVVAPEPDFGHEYWGQSYREAIEHLTGNKVFVALYEPVYGREHAPCD